MCAANTRAILKHVLEINQVAIVHVLCKVVSVMEMDKAVIISFSYIFWKQILISIIAAPFTRHIITLDW